MGEATARSDAAGGLIDGFITKAHDDGAAHDATHYQVSIVQFTENTVRVYGADNFPASVLTTVGVDRPAAQRFTDKPYIEVGSTEANLAHADFSAADADWCMCRSIRRRPKIAPPRCSTAIRGAGSRPTATIGSSWSTTRFGRPAEGLIAARGVIDDLRFVNAPIN